MTQDINARFISFEGIDFSGKSTQIQRLKAYLEQKGFSVFVLREPGGTKISESIRDLLLDKKNMQMNDRAEMLLYSAARVQLTQEKIMPLLQNGGYVLADRFVDSTTAYQGYGRGLEQETIRHVNNFATFGLLPSKTFYLKISPETGFGRRKESGRTADRLELAGLEFYKNVCAGYDAIALAEPKRFVVLDGTQVEEEIHRQIIESIHVP